MVKKESAEADTAEREAERPNKAIRTRKAAEQATERASDR